MITIKIHKNYLKRKIAGVSFDDGSIVVETKNIFYKVSCYDIYFSYSGTRIEFSKNNFYKR